MLGKFKFRTILVSGIIKCHKLCNFNGSLDGDIICNSGSQVWSGLVKSGWKLNIERSLAGLEKHVPVESTSGEVCLSTRWAQLEGAQEMRRWSSCRHDNDLYNISKLKRRCYVSKEGLCCSVRHRNIWNCWYEDMSFPSCKQSTCIEVCLVVLCRHVVALKSCFKYIKNEFNNFHTEVSNDERFFC